MKKGVLLLLIIVLKVGFLSSCENIKDSSSGIIEKEQPTVFYRSGIYSNLNWDEIVETYKSDVIPDEKTAIEIAKAIFNGMEKSKERENHIPNAVFYDEKDEIWIVSFWEDTDKNILGGDCSIAMQKKDGKVLNIWFGG